MQTPAEPTLRHRKRARTRAAIVVAGADLFERVGYDKTTVADIAAAADIGTRTFFSYFASKEELLFPESDDRVLAAIDAIVGRRPGDTPAELLLGALTDVTNVSDDMVGHLAALRMRLMHTVPAVRARSMQMQLDAQREIARHLVDAFPELEPIEATAIVGAFVGAVAAALDALLSDSDAVSRGQEELSRRLRQAARAALSSLSPPG
jgi:AcrR family transcriptional regulator